MAKTYSIWQLLILCAIAFFVVSGVIYSYDRITNPDNIWCIRYYPNGTEQHLRGADCSKP